MLLDFRKAKNTRLAARVWIKLSKHGKPFGISLIVVFALPSELILVAQWSGCLTRVKNVAGKSRSFSPSRRSPRALVFPQVTLSVEREP